MFPLEYEPMKKIPLERLQPEFVFKVKDYLQKHGMKQKALCLILDMEEPHLSNLLNKRNDRYVRKLSAHYLHKFILKGVIKVNEIYDGHPESNREEKYWELMEQLEDMPLMKKLRFARDLGLDANAWLDGYIQARKKDNKV